LGEEYRSFSSSLQYFVMRCIMAEVSMKLAEAEKKIG
jgi:hypothetical protein